MMASIRTLWQRVLKRQTRARGGSAWPLFLAGGMAVSGMAVGGMAVSGMAVGGMVLSGCVAAAQGAPPQRPVSPSPPSKPKQEISLPAAVEDPEASSATGLPSKVTEVTVYSDRALVTRRARAQVTKEPRVFAFRKLPGWVDDGSVRVASSEGRILNVRVERSFLARPTDKSYQRATAENQALKHRLEALSDELAVLEAEKRQIEGIRAFSLNKINKGALLGGFKVTSYGEVVSFISNAMRANAKARREVRRKQEEIAPEYAASQRRLAELGSLMKLEETTVMVTLQGSRDAEGTLELSYLIPGVTWEPMHDLRASTTQAKTAEVSSFAVVTQTSGEDWEGAQIAFSTQSSSQSMRIPELEALTLGDTHTATRILTRRMSSFVRAQEAFQQQNQLWNRVRQKSREARLSFDQSYRSKLDYLQVVQSRTVRLFETLQRRGTTAHFKAQAALGVRGDGHPVRMRIGQATLQTRQEIIAAPEQSLNAARTLEMTNSTGQPLLPGRVALFQDEAFLGMTDLDFIAQGERFSLFLSVADHLKLTRKLDRKESAIVRKRRSHMKLSFLVSVENLSPAETELTVADRIPVSENKEIRVFAVKISDNRRPDSQGLLRWKLRLKPGERRELRIAYQIEYPKELILETRRRQSLDARSARGARRPSTSVDAPSPRQQAVPQRRKYRIEEQLMNLEKLF